MSVDPLASVLGWTGKAALGVFLISLPVHLLLAKWLGTSFIPAMMLVSLGAFAFMILAVGARAMILAAKDAQPRLAELLAAVGVLSLSMAVVLPVRGSDEPGWAIELVLRSGFAAIVVAFGSLYGWSAIRRMQESRTLARFLLLAAGWAALPGLFAAMVGVLQLCRTFDWHPHPVLVTAACSITILPAWWVERRIRSR